MILDLVNRENSDIGYKISKFPDGQQNILIDKLSLSETIPGIKELIYHSSCQIKSRLNNWLDLELIICSVASLKELGIDKIHLYTPYIVGARSDRKFEEGGNNYLKNVICPVINSLNFTSVTCIDPHSDVLEACINNFKKKSNVALCQFTFDAIYGAGKVGPFTDPSFILLSPDAGASKKIYKVAKEIGYDEYVITCGKDRDESGNLTKCVIPNNINAINKDVIIIDDICDGGKTFINIAEALREYQHNNIYLIVTHGIFSKGLKELSEYFNGIYCTNSYSNMNNLGQINSGDFDFKQLNIF